MTHSEHGKHPGKEAESSFSSSFSKNPAGFLPLFLSFKPGWVQTFKFHPRGATMAREIFPGRFFQFFWSSESCQLSIPQLLPSLSPGWPKSQIIGKLTRKKKKGRHRGRQILQLDLTKCWEFPTFPRPGGRSGSYRNHGRASCWIQLLDGGTGGLHTSPRCSKLQLWPQGSLRKMGFSCQLHQQIQVYEPLSVNSNSGSVKLFLGPLKIRSRLHHGISFQRNTEKTQPNPKKKIRLKQPKAVGLGKCYSLHWQHSLWEQTGFLQDSVLWILSGSWSCWILAHLWL